MHRFRRAFLPASIVTALSLALAGLVFAEDPHWDYYDHGGAAGWAELDEDGSDHLAFPDCALAEQSPVNIEDVLPLQTGLAVDYHPTDLDVLNNGHTLQVNYDDGSTMVSAGKTYDLLQFHFHSPSEHELDGRQTVLEVHFVHQADDGEYAVIGVMIVPGNHNSAFQDVLDIAPESEGEASGDGTIDGAALLPSSLAYYAYDGSFTTPPCTEGVKWHVLSEPIMVSLEQVAAFRNLEILNHDDEFVGNARPVQPLNEREINAVEHGEDDGSGDGITPPNTGEAGLKGR